MERIELIGIDGAGKQARLGKDVIMFGNEQKCISLVRSGDEIRLTTSKAKHVLKKHPTQNYYQAVCNGYKVQVSLQKVKGELRYWN